MVIAELIQDGDKFRFNQDRVSVQQYSSGVKIHVQYDKTYDGYVYAWRYSLYIGMADAHSLEYDSENCIITLPYAMLKEVTKEAKVYLQGKATKDEHIVQTNTIVIKVIKSLNDTQIVSPDEPSDITLITGIVNQKFEIDIIPQIEQITKDSKQYRDDAKLSADRAETMLSEVIETADSEKALIIETASNETKKACVAIEAYKNDKNAELQASVDDWKGEISAQGEKITQDANGILDNVSLISETVSENAETVKTSTQQAKTYRDDAGSYASNADLSAQQASTSAENALASKTDAETAKNNAKASETTASQKASDASNSEKKAKEYWANAQTEALNAGKSATSALDSKNSAQTNADAIKSSADKIKSTEITANKALSDASIAQLTADAGIVGNKKNGELIEMLDSNIDRLKQKNLEHAKVADADGRVVTIANGDGSFLVDYRSLGETHQDATIGAQLFDVQKVELNKYLSADGTINESDASCITDYIEFGDSQDITVNFMTGNVTRNYCYYDVNKNIINTEKNSFLPPKTITAIKNAKYVRITIDKKTMNTCMINYGTASLPVKPYTGGKTSPSPDFPQEMISKVVSEIKFAGANLLDMPDISSRTINGITYSCIDGIINAKGVCTAYTIINYHLLNIPDGDYFISTNGENILVEIITSYNGIKEYWTNKKFTVKSGAIVNINIAVHKDVTINTTAKPMLNRGTTALSWEPYQEQVVTLSQPITLRGLPVTTGGNVTIDGQQYISDSIEMADGEYVVVRRTSNKIYDGSSDENWIYQSTNTHGIANFYIPIKSKIKSCIMCDKLAKQDTLIADTINEGIYQDENNVFLKIKQENANDLGKLRTLLSMNNITVLYDNYDETTENLPLEDQIKIKSLCTFKGVSNITDDANTYKQIRYVVDFDRYAYLKQISFELALLKQQSGYTVSIDDSAKYYLKSIGMFGEIHQTTTTGKNMIPNNNIIFYSANNYVCSNLDYKTKGAIAVLENKQYIFSFETEVPANERDWNVFCYGTNDEKMEFTDLIHSGNTRKFTTPAGASKISYYAKITNNSTVSIEKAKVMLKEGYEIIPYEPYTGGKPSPSPDFPQEMVSKIVREIKVAGVDGQEQKVTLSQPITLRGLPVTTGGNVTIDGQQYISDSIEMADGDTVNHIKKISIQVLNESNTWAIAYGNNNAFQVEISNYLFTPKTLDDIGRRVPSICDHFIWQNTSTLPNDGHYKTTYNETQKKLYICFRCNSINGMEAWKEFVKNNPITVLSEAEPIYTPLPEADQQAIKELQTYSHNTNITADGAWISVEYVANQQINNDRLIKRLEALEGVVVNNV